MATLKDLCTAIPVQMMRDQVIREVNRRKVLSYAQRMQSLDEEVRVFEYCRTTRPERGRAKNRYSREEAGIVKPVVMAIRTSWNSVVVCKSRRML